MGELVLVDVLKSMLKAAAASATQCLPLSVAPLGRLRSDFNLAYRFERRRKMDSSELTKRCHSGERRWL